MRGFSGILVCVLLAAAVHAQPSRFPHGVDSDGDIQQRGSRVVVESTLIPTVWAGGDMFPGHPLPLEITTNTIYTASPLNGWTRIRLRVSNEYNRANGYIEFGNGKTISVQTLDPNATREIIFDYVESTNRIPVRYVEYPALLLSNAPPIITYIEFLTMSDTGLIWRVADMQNQKLEVDALDSPRSVVQYEMAERMIMTAREDAEYETYNRSKPTDLRGYPLRHSPRFVTSADTNTYTLSYGGSSAFEVSGEHAQIVPDMKGIQVSTGQTLTVRAWTSAQFISNIVVQLSSNMETWVNIPSGVVSRTMIDDFTAQFVISNSLASVGYIRLLDTSGGSMVPFATMRGDLRVVNDLHVGGRIYLGSTNVWIGIDEDDRIKLWSNDEGGFDYQLLTIAGQRISGAEGTIGFVGDAFSGWEFFDVGGIHVESGEISNDAGQYWQRGNMYYDSTNNVLKVWSGSAWKSFEPVP